MITTRIPAFFKRLFYADAICYLNSLILKLSRLGYFSESLSEIVPLFKDR